MRICCILHADFELPGYFETWSNKNDYLFFQFCPYLGEKLPDYNSFDILLVMGGPQSACDTENYPYLLLEMELIKTAAAKNKFVLGVCLGAQLISESFGFKTQESPEKEFGVFSLTKTAEGKKAAILDGLPNKFLSGHWHNDMPGLPDGASVLIESEGCPRQLIRYTPRIYGFQCHLELSLIHI